MIGMVEFSWTYFFIVSGGMLALLGIAAYLGECNG